MARLSGADRRPRRRHPRRTRHRAHTAARLLAGGLTLDDLPASRRLETGRGRTVADQLDLARKWRDMIRLHTDLDIPWRPAGTASPPLPTASQVVDALGLW